MITALRALAERIDADCKAAGYRPRDLPAIAAHLLQEMRPDRYFDLATLAG
jgi:hypothetical protein